MRQRRDNLTAPLNWGRAFPSSRAMDLFLPHSCALYKPAVLTVAAGTKEVQDLRYTLLASSVRCFLSPTPETDQPTIMGRTKVVNIFTLDKFLFASAQEILDTYIIELLTADHPDAGQFWVVQGNPVQADGFPMHPVHVQMVYGKVMPPTASITKVQVNSESVLNIGGNLG